MERDNNNRQLNITNTNRQVLSEFGRSLNVLAFENKITNCFGRDKEMEEIITIISKEKKRNAILVGEAGVGKTAIVEGVAQKIQSGQVPDTIKGKEIWEVRISDLIAGASMKGEAERRLKSLLQEVKDSSNTVILFIDEIHTVLNNVCSGFDVSNTLKPLLARGDIMCIGATTYKEYQQVFEKDEALNRRFQKIDIAEPDKSTVKLIIKGIKSNLENYHNILINDEVIDKSIDLCEKYLPYKKFPDKVIDLLDEACSYQKNFYRGNSSENSLKDLIIAKERALADANFELAAEIHRQISLVSNSGISEVRNPLEKSMLTKIISKWTNIPKDFIAKSLSEKVNDLYEELNSRIIGQDSAKLSLINSLKRMALGFKSKNRPLYTALYIGPTGVGKSEFAKSMAKNLLGTEKSLIRIDMSEYKEEHSVSRLIGAPPGYVGYDSGGQLVNEVRKKGFCLVLLDEIEKAHYSIFDVFLQMLEEGELTDGQGNKADFRNTYIIMTSNLSLDFLEKNSLGFSNDNNTNNIDTEEIRKKLRKQIRPEILNRIDDIILFDRLTIDNTKDIVKLNLIETKTTLMKENNINIEYNDSLINYLTFKGYSPEFGAREIKRTIQKEVLDRIADSYNSALNNNHKNFELEVVNDRVIVRQNNLGPIIINKF